MRTVVDASVVAKWYLPEPGCEAADELLAAATAGEHELLAPDLLLPELTNVLWKKVRGGECDADSAAEILELLETDCPLLIPSRTLAPRALELALALGHPVYDCLYLAAAIEADARLATADATLARAARTVLAEVERIA